MAIQTEPTRIQIPFADSGSKNTIPATNSTPSASQAASWTDGFPAQCSLPLSAGGIPPARADFNGILNAMTQSERFTQEGGVWAWDATVDYGTNRLALGSDELLYWSIAQSGPNVGGAQDPTADTTHTYWVSPKVPTMPASDSSYASASTEWVRLWNQNNIVPADLYVDPVNGNDSNSGISAGSAKKTIAAVLAIVNDAAISVPDTVRIHLATGTYTEGLIGTFRCTINYIGVSGTIVPRVDAVANTIQLSGTFQIGSYMQAHTSGLLVLINGASFSWVNVSNSYAMSAYSFGEIRVFNGATVSFSFTNCTFSSATVTASNMGQYMFAGSESWSGNVTGKRYSATNVGQMIGFGSANTIPGTVAGTTDSTSTYS